MNLFEDNAPLTEEQYLERVHEVTEELFQLLWISNAAGTDSQPNLPVEWQRQWSVGDTGKYQGMFGIISDAIKCLNPHAYERFADSCEVKDRALWSDPMDEDRQREFNF